MKNLKILIIPVFLLGATPAFAGVGLPVESACGLGNWLSEIFYGPADGCSELQNEIDSHIADACEAAEDGDWLGGLEGLIDARSVQLTNRADCPNLTVDIPDECENDFRTLTDPGIIIGEVTHGSCKVPLERGR